MQSAKTIPKTIDREWRVYDARGKLTKTTKHKSKQEKP